METLHASDCSDWVSWLNKCILTTLSNIINVGAMLYSNLKTVLKEFCKKENGLEGFTGGIW